MRLYELRRVARLYGKSCCANGTERAVSLARLDVALGPPVRTARSHFKQAASAAVSLGDPRACGGSAADLEASRDIWPRRSLPLEPPAPSMHGVAMLLARRLGTPRSAGVQDVRLGGMCVTL